VPLNRFPLLLRTNGWDVIVARVGKTEIVSEFKIVTEGPAFDGCVCAKGQLLTPSRSSSPQSEGGSR